MDIPQAPGGFPFGPVHTSQVWSPMYVKISWASTSLHPEIEHLPCRFVISWISWIKSRVKKRSKEDATSWILDMAYLVGSDIMPVGAWMLRSVSVLDGDQTCQFFTVHSMLGWTGSSVSSPLSEEGLEALTELEDTSDHFVRLQKLVSSSDESCSWLEDKGSFSLLQIFLLL